MLLSVPFVEGKKVVADTLYVSLSKLVEYGIGVLMGVCTKVLDF